jgi:phosphoserine phosphatase
MILATASNQFVAEGVSEFLGFSHLICTELEMKNGFYTGRKVGQSSFQGGKLTRMHSWIADNGGSLERASFYSDSHNDLPLLEAVRSPIVVDPDDKLRQHAENLGWKIISKY